MYDNKHARFIQFIRYILGLEKLKSFSEEVTEAYLAIVKEEGQSDNQIGKLIKSIQNELTMGFR